MIFPSFVGELIKKIEDNGFEAFLVGGSVRDFLLGKDPSDFDIATSANPDDIIRIFEGYHIVPTGIKHGTVTVFANETPVEITTYRKDGKYKDFRHPESITFSADIKDDLSRRDFTVNAMAYNQRLGLLDLFSGRTDLSARIIRCVGDPYIRFREDALRIMRAIRFSAALGFRIEKETKDAIFSLKGLLKNISRERILDEFKKTLLADSVGNVLSEYFYIFEEILGVDIKSNLLKWKENAKTVSSAKKDFCIRTSLLLDGLIDFKMQKEVLTSLRFDKKTIGTILILSEHLNKKLPLSTPSIKSVLSKTGVSDFELILDAKEAKKDMPRQNLLTARIILDTIIKENGCFSLRQLKINGADLKTALGISGKAVGDILNSLLDAVIYEKCENEKHVLLEYAKKL